MAEVNGNQVRENHTNGSSAAGTNGSSKTPEANGFVKKPVVDMSVALRPNDLPGVPDIVKSISSLTTGAADGDEASRLELVEKARDLVRSLETPRETMIKHCWAQPAVFTAMTVGVDIGLFTALADDGGSPKTAQELAKKLHVDPPLLCRLMRHTATMGYIKEVGPDTYKPTNFFEGGKDVRFDGFGAGGEEVVLLRQEDAGFEEERLREMGNGEEDDAGVVDC